MTWIRSCLSVITDEFGLEQIVAARKRQDSAVGDAGLGVRLVSMATVQNRWDLRRLISDTFVYREQRSIPTASALSLTPVGAIALEMLPYGELAL